ncbi:hypothetical protein ACFPM0_09975 [Pseudonocardia sulfidoxydans]
MVPRCGARRGDANPGRRAVDVDHSMDAAGALAGSGEGRGVTYGTRGDAA